MVGIRWNKASLLLGALAVSVSLLSKNICAQVSPGLTFSAKAIAGKVVDAETGEPLAGVNIVAQWRIDRSFVGDEHALLKVIETVSDKGGNYGFPAWGPILLRPMSLFGNGRNPEIAYFKSGYWPEYEKNEIHDDDDIANREPPLGEFLGNGKTIKLRKWDGKDVLSYHSGLSSLAGNLPTYYRGGDWRKYPRMTLTIEKAGQELHQEVSKKGKAWWGDVQVNGFDLPSLSEDDMKLIQSLKNEK